VVKKSIPESRRLEPFAAGLRQLSAESIPTLGQLSALLRNPSGGGDLTTLLSETPSLARIAIPAFPQLIHQMNVTQAQLNYFREYTPDVVAALSDVGQTGAYYDANGHYARTQAQFDAFAVNGANQLTAIPSFDNRYSGLHVVHSRCPGGALQAPPDGSAPRLVPGCTATTTPPGP
jgi:phospholipid/cholesterol/gamma-HCH transport system substrate-binding protein